MTNRNVPYTNNFLRTASPFQRDLPQGHPRVPLRMGSATYAAAFRSVVSTANANGASVLDTVKFVRSAKRPERHWARAR
jgi:hypothetical protein